jgi:replication factor C subunit 1
LLTIQWLLANYYRYNSMSHPVPFMKASNVLAPKSQTKPAPDLEEAIEEEDYADVVEALPAEDDDEIDFKKDKLIKQPKAKKTSKKAAKATADDEDDGAAKKGGKTKAPAAKGRGRK